MAIRNMEKHGRTRIGVQVYNGLPFGTLEAAAQAAESSGYDLFMVTEGPEGMETPPLIASLARSTSNIMLGTAVIPIFFRGAALMTQMASTLHNITQGRFVLGLGTGHAHDLWKEHAVPLERPFQRMREYVHVIREAMAQGHISYEGKVITVPELRLPFPPPRNRCPFTWLLWGPRWRPWRERSPMGFCSTWPHPTISQTPSRGRRPQPAAPGATPVR